MWTLIFVHRDRVRVSVGVQLPRFVREMLSATVRAILDRETISIKLWKNCANTAAFDEKFFNITAETRRLFVSQETQKYSWCFWCLFQVKSTFILRTAGLNDDDWRHLVESQWPSLWTFCPFSWQCSCVEKVEIKPQICESEEETVDCVNMWTYVTCCF